jgi:hypothetical protein
MAKKRHYSSSKHEKMVGGMSSRHGYHADTTAYGEVDSGTMHDSMIHNEPNQMSGLPLDVKMLDYPKNNSFMPYGLEWGYQSEDKQMNADRPQISRQVKPRKA